MPENKLNFAKSQIRWLRLFSLCETNKMCQTKKRVQNVVAENIDSWIQSSEEKQKLHRN